MAKQLKLVFLDLDGVVNSTRSVYTKLGPVAGDTHPVLGAIPFDAAYALRCVDPVCVELVNKLFETDERVGVVLSSSHRMNFHQGQYGSLEHLQRLQEYLKLMGFRLPGFFDITPVLHRPRGEEVKAYLDAMDDADQPKFQCIDYVILDDGRDFKDTQPLVHIDASIGMDFPNYVDACKFLAVSEPSRILV